MIAKKTQLNNTNIPVQNLICIKKIIIGKAALASNIKNLAVLAESRQCAVGGKPAIRTPFLIINKSISEIITNEMGFIFPH
jgi:hypothetical protein